MLILVNLAILLMAIVLPHVHVERQQFKHLVVWKQHIVAATIPVDMEAEIADDVRTLFLFAL